MSDEFENNLPVGEPTIDGISVTEPTIDGFAADATLSEEGSAPKKRRRWGRNQYIAVGAAVALLGGGGAWAYNAYESPTVVIGMAIGSLFSQSNPSYDIDLKVDGVALQGEALDFNMQVSSADAGADVNLALALSGTLNGSANLEMMSSSAGDYYLQVSKFDSLLPTLEALTGFQSYGSILNSINGKWVKISKTEIDQVTGGSTRLANCLRDKFKDPAYAGEVRNELIDLGKSHVFFISVKDLGVSGGNIGYQVGFDVKQLKAFLTGFVDSKLYDDVIACETGSNDLVTTSKTQAHSAIEAINETDFNNGMKNIKIELWADLFSHNLSSLSITTTQNDANFAMTFKNAGDRSSRVKIPTENVLSLTDVALLAATGGN